MTSSRVWLKENFTDADRRDYEAAENRRYRERHPDRDRAIQRRWNNKHPERIAAHQAVYRAVCRGDLRRPRSCEGCGTGCKPQACHWDYRRQLNVIWLCRPCHRHMDTEVLRGEE